MSSNDSDPFFMWMSFNVPHSPVLATDDSHLNYFSHIQNADRREYLAALWRMDYKVGELVAKLKETGEFDNTIIVYTSDNGPTGEGLVSMNRLSPSSFGTNFFDESGVSGSMDLC